MNGLSGSWSSPCASSVSIHADPGTLAAEVAPPPPSVGRWSTEDAAVIAEPSASAGTRSASSRYGTV